MTYRSLLSVVALTVSVHAANYRRVTCPDGVNTATNAACCAFFSLRDDLLTNLFGGVCGEEAHESLRLAFHDAIAISPAVTATGKFGGGGADGSMIIFPNVEPTFPPNAGISDSVDFLTPFLADHNVTAGDLIQFAAAVGITLCPGAPQLQFLAGRAPAVAPAPQGLIPEPSDSVTTILARFADAGKFSPAELVALLASHSIARSDHIEPGMAAVPFDSTPFTFDTQFFVEVQLASRQTLNPNGQTQAGEDSTPLPQSSGQNIGEIRINSDHDIARDSRTSCTWQSFVNNQALMASSFKAAMQKLAILGHNANNLIDCSEVVPVPLPAVNKPATLPAGKSMTDIEQACATAPFPTLATDPGPATLIPHCPPSQGGDADDCDDDEGSL